MNIHKVSFSGKPPRVLVIMGINYPWVSINSIRTNILPHSHQPVLAEDPFMGGWMG